MTQTEETVQAHDLMWPQRVGIISDRLHRFWPDDMESRVSAGTAIARNPKWFRVVEGKRHVWDGDREKWLVVNGVCKCGDTEETGARGHFCKHRIADDIFQKAQALPAAELTLNPATYGQDAPEPPPPDDTAPAPQPDAWQREDAAQETGFPRAFLQELAAVDQSLLEAYVQARVHLEVAERPTPLPEAPASVNFRVSVQGHDVQWTLRDADEDRLAARLEALMAKYPVVAAVPAQPGCQAAPRQAAGEAPPATPQPVPGQAGEPGERRLDWCYECAVPMKRQHDEKSGDIWYFHKVAGLYCHGYGPGVRRPRS